MLQTSVLDPKNIKFGSGYRILAQFEFGSRSRVTVCFQFWRKKKLKIVSEEINFFKQTFFKRNFLKKMAADRVHQQVA